MTVNLNNHSKTQKSLNLSTSLSFLQINLRHSKAASAPLSKTIDDHNINIFMAQEPYAVKVNDNILFNAPGGFAAHHKLNPSQLLSYSTNNVVRAKRFTDQKVPLLLISAYCRPTINSVSSFLEHFLSVNHHLFKNSIICLDSNAKNTLWNNASTDDKGKDLENLISQFPISVTIILKDKLPFLPTKTSFIDVTLHGSETKTIYRKYLDEPSLSEHPYIYFLVNRVNSKANTNKKRKIPGITHINQESYKLKIADQIDQHLFMDLPDISKEGIDKQIAQLTSIIADCATACMIRPEPKPKSKLTPWWSMELTVLRSKTRRALKTWMSTKHPIDKVRYSSLKREYQLAVRSAELNSLKLFIQETLNKDLHSALKEISSKEVPSSQPLS
jgi:hypothetical protein